MFTLPLWSMVIHLVMADSDDCSIVRLISFNSRGFNESKKHYISSILSDCDILFLQEHWLSDDQFTPHLTWLPYMMLLAVAVSMLCNSVTITLNCCTSVSICLTRRMFLAWRTFSFS